MKTSILDLCSRLPRRIVTAGGLMAVVLASGCRATTPQQHVRWSLPFSTARPIDVDSTGLAADADSVQLVMAADSTPRAVFAELEHLSHANQIETVNGEKASATAHTDSARAGYVSAVAAHADSAGVGSPVAKAARRAPKASGPSQTAEPSTQPLERPVVGAHETAIAGGADLVSGTTRVAATLPAKKSDRGAAHLSTGLPALISTGLPSATASWNDIHSHADARPPITLDQAEQLALSTSPLIGELQARLDALCGKKIQATLPPNPKVGVTGSDIFEDGTGGRHGVYFGREIVRGNKLGLSAATVNAEIQVARQQLMVAEQRLRTDVRLAWFDLLVAERKQALTEQLTKIAGQAVETSRQLFEAQEVARTAILQAEMEYQRAIVATRQVAAERTAAARRLATLMGHLDLGDTPVDGDPESMLTTAEFELAFDEILSSSPELAALRLDVERARRNIARQCAEPIPNLTWQASVLYDTVSDNIVTGYQVGIPIPVRNRNQGAVQQARREMEAAAYRAEKRALALRQNLAKAFEAYTRAKVEADVTREQILPRARQTLDLVVQGYAQGEVDFLNLLTAQRTYFDANLNYLNALKQVWREGNRIRGFLLDNGLQMPADP